jgi:hypothetical protein
MLQFISSLLLLSFNLLSVFCQTTTESHSGLIGAWIGRQPTPVGWVILIGSLIAFCLGAASQYFTQYRKGKIVSFEIKSACSKFLHVFYLPYFKSLITEITSTPNFKSNQDQEAKQKKFIEYIYFGGNIRTLIQNGTTKRLFEVNLNFDIPGQENFQTTFKAQCETFRLALADIIGRYQSVLSSGQLIALTEVREGWFLRNVRDSSLLPEKKQETLKDYYMTQEQFDDFLRSVDNLRHDRFTPFYRYLLWKSK